jgi:urease accessory protein
MLLLEWFETNKNIIRKRSLAGREVAIRKRRATPLYDGDILYIDGEEALTVKILACPCIVIRPQTIREMAIVCAEIGNKHIPIYINDEQEVIIAFERPLFHLLAKGGFRPTKEERIIAETNTLTLHRWPTVSRSIINKA